MVNVTTGAVQINQLNTNSNFNQGDLVANGSSIFSKTNAMITQIGGNFNMITSGINFVFDPDALDYNLPNAGGQSPPMGGIAQVL